MCFSSIHWSVWKGFSSSRARKQNVWNFQTQDHYKHLSENVTVTLWFCGTKPNREWRMFSSLWLWMDSRVKQIAKADSVYCLNITQNVSCLPWSLWCYFEQRCYFEQIYLETLSIFFWQLKIHMSSHWQLYKDFYLILSFSVWILILYKPLRKPKRLTM